MDTTYSSTRNKNFKWPVLIVVLIVLLGVFAFFIFSATPKFVSPLPDTPAVEIIFYTPTPEPVTPTSSPSATPKVTVRPSSTTVPTKSVTVTPTKEITPTPT